MPEINYLFGMLLLTFELLLVLLQMFYQGSAAEKHEGRMEEVHSINFSFFNYEFFVE